MPAEFKNIFPLHHKDNRLTGVLSKEGPKKPNIIQDYEAMSLTSRLGKISERAAALFWSGSMPIQSNNLALIGAAEDVRYRLEPVRLRTFQKHFDLAPFYQELTKPAEIVLFGDERREPSLASLAYIFKEVDETLGTDLMKKFQEIGMFTSDTPEPKIRYLIECSLVLAKLITQPKPELFGHLQPNVWFSNLCQFDGVICPENTPNFSTNQNFELNEFLQTNQPWGVLEIKLPLRARHVTGKLLKPFPRDIRTYQTKIGRVVLQTQDPDAFPNFMAIAYLRGVRDHSIHFVRTDYDFLNTWRLGLEVALDNDHYNESESEQAEILREMINEKLHELEIKEEFNRIMTKKQPYQSLTQLDLL